MYKMFTAKEYIIKKGAYVTAQVDYKYKSFITERQVGILEEDDTMDFLQRSEMGEREEEGEREGSSQRMTPLSMTPTTDEKTKEKRQMAERERLAALSEGGM